MKKLLLITSLLCTLITANAQYTLSLKNSNTKTRGITKMSLVHKNNKVKVKIWAKCHPNDCYWGSFNTVQDVSYKEYLQRTKSNWIPRYNPFTIKQSHVARRVTIYKHRSNSMYKVTVDNDYKSAKKKDVKKTYYMKK